MKTKNLMVFFLAIVSILLVAGTASAEELADIDRVKVDGVSNPVDKDISVVAGETVNTEVYFTALEDASDVRIEAEVNGHKIDISEKIGPMDLEEGKSYRESLNLRIPYELQDEVSDDLRLELKIWNSEHETEYEDVSLRVQRPSYNAAVMSIETEDNVAAGDVVDVTSVIKNIGYNYLNDVYVTIKIPELDYEKEKYVGDIVATECDERNCDEDAKDTASTRTTFDVPYEAEPGTYNLEVEVRNPDLQVDSTKELVIDNEFASGNLIASSLKKSFNVGETADYELVVANPTDKLKVYRLITDEPQELDLSLRNSAVAVPAGSSKTINLEASSEESGEYEFDVDLLSDEEVMNTVTMKANVEGEETTQFASPVVVLTIVLAVVFLVLLIVLIVLLGKKPERTEDFGESYY